MTDAQAIALVFDHITWPVAVTIVTAIVGFVVFWRS